MSQLEQGFLPDRLVRRGTPSTPRIAQTESLTTPGLAVTPPVTSDKSARLLAAVDAIGNAIGYAGAAARHEQIQIEQAQRDAEVKAAEADRLMAGAGSLDYRTYLPQLESDIASGKVADPGDLNAFADQVVSQRTQGQSDAYRKAYEQIKPSIVAAFVRRREGQQAQSRAELLQLYGSSATEETTPEGISAVLDEARGKFKDVPETDLRGAIVLPALKSAALAGDSVRFGAALAALGPGFDVERQQALNAFNSTRDRQQTDAVRSFRDDIAGGYIDNIPFGTLENRIRKYRGKVPDDVIDQELRGLEVRRGEGLIAALKASVDEELKAKKAAIVLDAGPILESGNPLIDDQTITTADGKEHTFKRLDIIDAARENAFRGIDQKFPPNQPETAGQNLSIKLRWLSRVPEAKDPTLTRLWAGFASRVTPDTTDATMPPALVAAYQTYRQAEPQAPAVVAAHLQSDDREILRAASFIQDNIPGITPAAALISAAGAADKGVILSDAISRELSGQRLTAVLRDQLEGDAANFTDASKIVERRARAYMLAYGASEEAAVAEAAKRFKEDFSIVNGHYVNTVTRPVAKAINADLMGEAVVRAWAKDAGEDPADYTLIPDSRSDAWYIAQAGIAVPAPGTPRIADSELQDLNRWWNEMDAAEAEDLAIAIARERNAPKETDFVGGKPGSPLFRRDLEGLQAYWGRTFVGPPEPVVKPERPTPNPPASRATLPALKYLINKRLNTINPPPRPPRRGPATGHLLE